MQPAPTLDLLAAPGVRRRAAGALLLPLLSSLACCERTPLGPGPLPLGPWGGIQGNLVVFADSVTLDLPCAAARIPSRLATDPAGRFDVTGQWAPAAGPILPGGPNWRDARFTGRREGDVLQVTVQVSGGTPGGPLTFRRGVVGSFPRCV